MAFHFAHAAYPLFIRGERMLRGDGRLGEGPAPIAGADLEPLGCCDLEHASTIRAKWAPLSAAQAEIGSPRATTSQVTSHRYQVVG